MKLSKSLIGKTVRLNCYDYDYIVLVTMVDENENFIMGSYIAYENQKEEAVVSGLFNKPTNIRRTKLRLNLSSK